MGCQQRPGSPGEHKASVIPATSVRHPNAVSVDDGEDYGLNLGAGDVLDGGSQGLWQRRWPLWLQGRLCPVQHLSAWILTMAVQFLPPSHPVRNQCGLCSVLSEAKLAFSN